MAPSTPRFDRTKHHQDSPTFWLLVMAGSLALHLIVLLIGRWYVTRVTIETTSGSPAPVEFVEIDPNAPAVENLKPVAPDATAAESQAQTAPPGDSQPSTKIWSTYFSSGTFVPETFTPTLRPNYAQTDLKPPNATPNF